MPSERDPDRPRGSPLPAHRAIPGPSLPPPASELVERRAARASALGPDPHHADAGPPPLRPAPSPGSNGPAAHEWVQWALEATVATGARAPSEPRPRPVAGPRATAGAYVELHAHSAFSFLDGASQPEELVDRAALLGHDTLALTDHDNLCGALVFAHAARAAGVRPITGAELTVVDETGPMHATLLVESRHGYAHLCELLTAGHARGHGLDPQVPFAALLERAEGWCC
jgi:hypothetical protein